VLILLDENLLSKKLKQSFLEAGHSVNNVYDMGWRGLKDREILDLAENHPFDVFITADKNLQYQQNLENRFIRIVVLDSSSTRPDRVIPLMVQVSSIVESLPVGAAIRINDAGDVVSISP
jgi:predicted nuclease of predicted toxin-antitoxin system